MFHTYAKLVYSKRWMDKSWVQSPRNTDSPIVVCLPPSNLQGQSSPIIDPPPSSFTSRSPAEQSSIYSSQAAATATSRPFATPNPRLPLHHRSVGSRQSILCIPCSSTVARLACRLPLRHFLLSCMCFLAWLHSHRRLYRGAISVGWRCIRFPAGYIMIAVIWIGSKLECNDLGCRVLLWRSLSVALTLKTLSSP